MSDVLLVLIDEPIPKIQMSESKHPARYVFTAKTGRETA